MKSMTYTRVLLVAALTLMGVDAMAQVGQRSSTVETDNFIINGNMEFAQRGTTSSSTSTAYLTVDRFRTGNSCSSAVTSQDTAVPNTGSKYSLAFTGSCTSANRFLVQQRIESSNAIYLGGKKVTLSFYYLATLPNLDTSTANSFVALDIPSASDNWASNDVFSTTAVGLTADGTWRKATYTFTVPTLSPTSSYPITNGLAFQLKLQPASGTNSWTFKMTQVMLNIGPTAAPFKLAGGDIQGELAKCQRYTFFPVHITPYQGTGAIVFAQAFPVVMRANPVIRHTLSDATYNSGGGASTWRFMQPGINYFNKTGTVSIYPGNGVSSEGGPSMGYVAFTAATWAGIGGATLPIALNLGAGMYLYYDAEL